MHKVQSARVNSPEADGAQDGRSPQADGAGKRMVPWSGSGPRADAAYERMRSTSGYGPQADSTVKLKGTVGLLKK